MKFKDFIGNIKAKAKISLLMHDARGGGRLPHMAFLGPPGVGKTTMADIVGRELGRKFVYVSATSISNPMAFRKVLTDPKNIAEGAIVLIDECHRLKPLIQDNLLSVLEKPAVLVTVVKDEIIHDPLPDNISFIFATTHAGLIRNALYTRLETVMFASYTIEEKEKIAIMYLKEAKMPFDKAVPLEVGVRCRNGRQIVNTIENLGRHARTKKKNRITIKEATEAFKILDIDTNGLTREDHRYLAAITMLGQVGIDTLSAFIQVPKKDIQDKIEPWLLQNRFVLILHKGRFITPRGIKATEGVRSINPETDGWLND